MSKQAVLLISDWNQLPPAVFLASRLAKLKKDRDVDIVLATDSDRGLAQLRDFRPDFRVVDARNLYRDQYLPAVRYFTRATYFSLFVPTLLGADYERVLFVDVDTYPESDRVFALLGLDMGDLAVAAVRDLHVPFMPNPTNGEELMSTLRISPEQCFGAKYLNSGALLLDLPAYRRTKIERRALEVISEKRLAFHMVDQTVFNAVLRTDWLELSPSFNMITRAWASFIRRFAPPAIVHFTGPVKPWHRQFVDPHPVVGELAAFLANTPWPTFIADSNPPPNLLKLGSVPPLPERQLPLWQGPILQRLIRFLAETPFADVEQGITTPDRRALIEAWSGVSPAQHHSSD